MSFGYEIEEVDIFAVEGSSSFKLVDGKLRVGKIVFDFFDAINSGGEFCERRFGGVDIYGSIRRGCGSEG